MVHTLRELDEKLGVLVIAVVADPDGHEVCLVSAETFELAVGEAVRDPVQLPAWEKRAGIGADWMVVSNRAAPTGAEAPQTK